MSLRINHNLAAENAQRSFFRKDFRFGKKNPLASNAQVSVKHSDGPATLVISERMRAEVVGLLQSVHNSESTISLVQTAEKSLNQIGFHLKSLRQLAIHVSSNAASGQSMLDANQAEVINALDQIDKIAKTSHYGSKSLLDGSNGIEAKANGEDLNFKTVSEKTQPSPPGGYKVLIKHFGARSYHHGDIPLTTQLIDLNEQIKITTGSLSLIFKTQAGESVKEFVRRLQKELKKNGAKIDVSLDSLDRLIVQHQSYGSDFGFGVTSSTEGLLSKKASEEIWVQNGQDVQGSIGSNYATGNGQFLSGGIGTPVEGLTIQVKGRQKEDLNESTYNPAPKLENDLFKLESGKSALPEYKGTEVGTVDVTTHALIFYTGGTNEKQIKILLPSTDSSELGRSIENRSQFGSLRDLDIRSVQGALDANKLIDYAIKEITDLQSQLGSVERQTLTSNIASLGIAKENVINAEATINDTVSAAQMAKHTRNQILNQSNLALLAQAHQSSRHVLTLLRQ
ncbi:MAG: hypothetical protein GY786_13360 [Proteobacteria bacterium]|nr:hypothetical protein [Pseudomonadota bacterium]